MTHKLLLGPLLLVLSLAGCEHSPAGLPVTSVKIGNRSFNLEVASTSSDQETGLMKRDSMPEDHGMIFVFPDEITRSFWMKNTRIPLDIIFLSTGGTVVSIRQMQPYDLSLTSSMEPARYAIELNQGAAESSGVKVGDHVVIPPEAKSK